MALLIGLFVISRPGSDHANAAPTWIDTTPSSVQTFYQNGFPRLPYDQRFFPNGMYFVTGAPEDANAIQTLHDAGFTVALGSGHWDPSAYVDASRGTNVRIIIDQSQHAHGVTNPPAFNESWFTRYKNDAGVLGWLLYDEPLGIAKATCMFNPLCTNPDLTVLGQLAAIYQAHQSQTDQILFVDEQALTQHPSWTGVLQMTDAAAHYNYVKYYPSAKTSLAPVAASVAAQTNAVGQQKPSWFIPQDFCCDGYGAYFPTVEKSRAQAYTAIVHGATGLINFAWDSQYARTLIDPTHGVVGIRPDTPTTYPGGGMAASPDQVAQSRALWGAVDARSGTSSLNRQLLTLTDALTSPTTTRPYSVAVDAQPISTAPVRTMVKEYNGSLYLIAVNMDNAPVHARFSFDRQYRVRELFATVDPAAPPAPAQQELIASFQPFGVHVYRMSSCLDPNQDGAINGSDILDLLQAAGAEAGFSPLYDLDRDYSGDGTIDWDDAELLVRDLESPLPGCAPCPDGNSDGVSDCQAYYLQARLAREPFLGVAPVVPAYDRSVCSLLGQPKQAAGITGQDSGSAVDVNGTIYWTFGDSTMAGGGMLPNAIGWSADGNASDCVTLTPKTQQNVAAPLLPKLPGELTVWPAGMELTSANQVHFFYDSVVADAAPPGWRVAGIGLAAFDTPTLTATRKLNGGLLWSASTGFYASSAHTVMDGGYIYIFLSRLAAKPGATETFLARVLPSQIESPGNYEYWSKNGWQTNLWNAGTNTWHGAITTIAPLWTHPSAHNGVDVAYNAYLHKWLAAYASDDLTQVSVRAANDLTGPWEPIDVALVDCDQFHPQGGGYLCYSALQHAYYSPDGGRTMYISYSNQTSYQTYLHEIGLAAPVSQWTDTLGHATYLAGEARGPGGWLRNGISFYASEVAGPGLTGIHRWRDWSTNELRYSATPPGDPTAYQDLGIDFYAPVDKTAAAATHEPHAPVYRWSKDGTIRYSPLNLAADGFTQNEIAFFAPCPDSDVDGLTDCDESFTGTDPYDADADGDGLTDPFERATPGCDAFVYNDDGDGIAGSQEALSGTNPCIWDTGAYGCSHGAVRPPGCTTDSDADGCTDAVELGPNQNAGGRRNAQNRWDFYDVNGDRVVTMREDLLAVIQSFGSVGSYAAAKDRRPPPPASIEPDPSRREPWDMGAPDGAITMLDVLGAARQFGHTCLPFP